MARSDLLQIGPADKATLLLLTLVSAIGHMPKMEGIGLAAIYIMGPFTPRISMLPRTNSPCHRSCTVNRRARRRPRHTDAMRTA